MFEVEAIGVERMTEALKFYSELLNDVHSNAPGSIGQEIRAEAMESDFSLQTALEYVVLDQLWGRQVDSDGNLAPRYKPDTVRKKIKLGHPADKLVNYTQAWTGRFYEHGVVIHADAWEDRLYFLKSNAYPHFQYIPDEYVGMTEENLAAYREDMEQYVGNAQTQYIRDAIERSEYAEILDALKYLGAI